MAEYKARAEAVRHAEVYRGFALIGLPGQGTGEPDDCGGSGRQ